MASACFDGPLPLSKSKNPVFRSHRRCPSDFKIVIDEVEGVIRNELPVNGSRESEVLTEDLEGIVARNNHIQGFGVIVQDLAGLLVAVFKSLLLGSSVLGPLSKSHIAGTLRFFSWRIPRFCLGPRSSVVFAKPGSILRKSLNLDRRRLRGM